MKDSSVPCGHHDRTRRYLVSLDCDTSQTSQRYERVKEIPRAKKPLSRSSEHPGSFPGSSDSKLSACNAGDLGLIPGSGRYPGEGNGNPLHHSSILAWRIPWSEEPGRLQLIGMQRVAQTKRLQNIIPGEGNGNPLQYSFLENPWTEERGGL